ncbi:MAG: hypothetical protein COB12_10790 [Flavobacterium sp.]|nr:MAG: hypothetical protein COB12_10790 [Flavobacterium sp.]
MNKKYNIAFIHLDDLHHINHFITIAIELSKSHNVSILTYPLKHEYLINKLQELNGDLVKVEPLKTLKFRGFTDKIKKRSFPRKGFWMKKNKDYLLTFDAIFLTDFIQEYLLKFRKERKKPVLIRIYHGFTGRSYSYKKELLDFDVHLLPGNYAYKEFEKRGLLKHTKIIGYPKLEAITIAENKNTFKKDQVTILYNPHFSPPFSSWDKFGLKVLEYFYKSDQYNLIFAPHINLFAEKGGELNEKIPKKYFESENIYIDLGSTKSVEMIYPNQADIYLGDVSSQVYEYIISPRPCIFINIQNTDYQYNEDFRFWRCGEVINSIDQLNDALENASTNFKESYKKIQKEINLGNLLIDKNESPSKKAAIVIEEYLENIDK